MFVKKKLQGVCEGHYTGEGVLNGARFNARGGQAIEIGNVQVEFYGLIKPARIGSNLRYPVYEYEVNGVVYRRAKEHVSYNIWKIEKMAGKPCKVFYNLDDPGKSKAR